MERYYIQGIYTLKTRIYIYILDSTSDDGSIQAVCSGYDTCSSCREGKFLSFLAFACNILMENYNKHT